jgi:hypothetical protein
MWIPMGHNGWPKVQCIKLRTKGWGRPKLFYNTKEKNILRHKKTWDDNVNIQLNYHAQPCVKLQTHLMRIRRHIRGDVGKAMFV